MNSGLDMKEFVRDWQISRQFTLDVANAMPANFYDFKPNPEEMTFGEQMIHIAGANVFRFNQIPGSSRHSSSILPSRLLPTRRAFSNC